MLGNRKALWLAESVYVCVVAAALFRLYVNHDLFQVKGLGTFLESSMLLGISLSALLVNTIAMRATPFLSSPNPPVKKTRESSSSIFDGHPVNDTPERASFSPNRHFLVWHITIPWVLPLVLTIGPRVLELVSDSSRGFASICTAAAGTTASATP
jgi:hypothetical protein